MKRFVGFGEILLRLSCPGHQILQQAHDFHSHVAGCENNVACAISRWGMPASMVSTLPASPLGDRVIRELQAHGVETRHILRNGHRLPLYFHETGVGPRPGSIVYDRAHSGFALQSPSQYPWPDILDDADFLHLSGITPALSEQAAAAAAEGARQAHQRGIPVSLDLNYRPSLWAEGSLPGKRIQPLAEAARVMLIDPDSVRAFFQIESDWRPSGAEAIPPEHCRRLGDLVFQRFHSLDSIIVSRRKAISATDQHFGAILLTRDNAWQSPLHPVGPVIDRLGAGDALMAGVLRILMEDRTQLERAIHFGAAAGALQHSIEGDICLLPGEEIEQMAQSGGSSRLKR